MSTETSTQGEACYRVLDTRFSNGNLASWWRPEGRGYTCNLAEAGLFTLDRASGMRDTDVPVHKDVAESLAVRTVSLDALRERLDELRSDPDSFLVTEVVKRVPSSVKRKRLKLDPLLIDGDHWSVGEPDSALLELIGMWMDDADLGDTVELELILMSDDEAKELPEI